MNLVFGVIVQLMQLYSWALIIYILMSWFPNARESSIGLLLGKICEPYLEVFRRFIPPIGMLDLSPLVAFFVLRLAQLGLNQVYYWII
ncbi:MAG: YggT family protein [Bacillus sp. (in: firmicutes)]